ncbi:hypothetical protein [Dictyobacter kobayashii]|uniref:hypothetical protein n=1 Tax=Dictyobacter kobayashii TaxID=2014872 RepID=UPI001FE25C04|nr:hypothetical protein [Dictyobacter kobayashii]
MANQLILGHNMVRNYVSNIFSKLQAVDRAHESGMRKGQHGSQQLEHGQDELH